MELQCSVQNYDWGKLGHESEVARLAAICSKSITVDESKPYAELWMGTHVNGPSFVVDTDESLSVWLQRNMDSLGSDVRKEFGDQLPFLFKVLSVRKALSIQAHPNKKHAEELHISRPDLYKDPNHKPELAIALTPFQAMCGFRSIDEIQYFLKELPELQTVLGEELCKNLLSADSDNKVYLKEAFRQLMQCDTTIIDKTLIEFLKRAEGESKEYQDKFLYQLLKRLHSEFPSDRGCWCIYFLNYVILKPGEAIFLGPNVPHAYLFGDCIECMACSDNVVRAGLTPKFIDVPTLIEMLIYESQAVDNIIFKPITEDAYTKVWRPPVKDFAVAEIRIPANSTSSYNTIMRPSASILLVISGNAKVSDSLETDIVRGSVLYLKASRQLTITKKDDSEDLIIYQAMCNFQ
ncbi:mannose phosphate isomerase [Arctopsyche grandis]|uniref:mannose phosphate isomerase n=1 Tax=Arctopsyche grandis TaxID=121162 RepID=UPI00406D6655